jgi:hypothetical protein
MTDLERRYRRWLRAYPKAYRQVRGEEILSTLLDAAPATGVVSKDLLHIVIHGLRVRWILLARRFGRGTLPRSVHSATLILVFMAVVNWLNAAFAHNGPKNPSSHVANIVVGFVFVVLCLMIQTWSRLLYAVVIGILAVIMAMSFVNSDLIFELNAIVPLILLMVGWRRYMAAIPPAEWPQPPPRIAPS